MRRKTALIAGASLLMVVGLSACGQQEQPVRIVQAAVGTPTPTSDPHDLIRDQLDSIEGKVDKLQPTTKTVTKTVTPAPVTTTKTVTQTATSTETVTQAAKQTTTSSSTPAPTSTTTTAPPPTTTTTTPPEGQQTLGVGGVASPPDAQPLPSIVNGKSTITTAGIYDCKGGTIAAQVVINTSNTTVQNCNVRSGSQYGIYSSGDSNTIQNNDIKNVKPSGDGDMNAITFFGNKTRIQFNTAIDFVGVSNPGSSHTDFIQTWVSTSHKVASDDVVIRSNKATGPANPSRSNSIPSIHQCVMVEDYGRGGNSGGDTDGMKNWLIVGNIFSDSWNQCIKNDGVDGFVVTKNDFQGSSTHVMEQAQGSGLLFYSDNKIGPGYGNVGVPITAGAGPV